MTSVTTAIARAPRVAMMGVIRGYQLVISPMSGPSCKYYPSCSNYGMEAVRVHGAFIGGLMAAWRVLRCNPFSNGGVDDVPARGERLFRLHRNNHSHHTHSDFPHAATAAPEREQQLALMRGSE